MDVRLAIQPVLILFSIIASQVAQASHDEGRLFIDWPSGWEYREPTRDDGVLLLQARQRTTASQSLTISIIDTSRASKEVGPDEAHDLVRRLRDSVQQTAVEPTIEIRKFGNDGYSFVATDRNHWRGQGGFRQLVEGVSLRSGYLINFTLLTNEAMSVATQQILTALERAQITIDGAKEARDFTR